MLIDVEAGTARVFSMGHRNPQGLYLDTGGTLWLTEHGPQGGDELNIVVDGGNYGWPLVSYGTEYGLAEWPLSIAQGDHAGFERPVFAWNPSIGVSSIIGVERDLFPWWRGDLLVGSLRAGTLWRVRVHEERVLLVEPIVINLGIRDLVEAGDGRLWFWLDGGSIAVGEPAPAPAPSETVAGELVLGQCRGCHQIGDGTAHGIGPDLAGVVGRDVASARGFAYSAALRATSGTWSPERLHRFLADPSADVPGTAMAFPGISDSTRRAAIIAYLRDPPGRR
jgi:cytochrome c2